LQIIWSRGRETINFNRPWTWFILGVRGSGKSTFLETLARYYLDEGHCILDLFGSRDGEGLAWLRSPYVTDSDDYQILLLHGESVDVEAPVDTKKASSLSLGDFEKYSIIISASPLYLNPDDEFINAASITDKLYKRLSWKKLVYTLVREAANLYYSRLKVSENQNIAKSQMIYLCREARHMGVALGLDSIRFYALDIDLRSISDFLVLKSQGLYGLSRDLNWLYSLFEPAIIRNMPQQFFLIVSRKGAVGLGEFPAISWHKREKEHILKSVGVSVEYGEVEETGDYRGTYSTLGDREHAEIITLYLEGLSMAKVAAAKSRSTKTIHDHINRHDRSVQRSGFCPACRRVRSPHEATKARKA
jgi:hypothetical protein